jgi:hypothetical protein
LARQLVNYGSDIFRSLNKSQSICRRLDWGAIISEQVDLRCGYMKQIPFFLSVFVVAAFSSAGFASVPTIDPAGGKLLVKATLTYRVGPKSNVNSNRFPKEFSGEKLVVALAQEHSPDEDYVEIPSSAKEYSQAGKLTLPNSYAAVFSSSDRKAVVKTHASNQYTPRGEYMHAHGPFEEPSRKDYSRLIRQIAGAQIEQIESELRTEKAFESDDSDFECNVSEKRTHLVCVIYTPLRAK